MSGLSYDILSLVIFGLGVLCVVIGVILAIVWRAWDIYTEISGRASKKRIASINASQYTRGKEGYRTALSGPTLAPIHSTVVGSTTTDSITESATEDYPAPVVRGSEDRLTTFSIDIATEIGSILQVG